VLVTDKVGDGEVLDRQLSVGLGELVRDLVQEGLASIGDSGMFPRNRTGCLDSITGPASGARESSRAPTQPSEPPGQWLGGIESINLDTVCGRGNRKGDKPPIHTDDRRTVAARQAMAALNMQVWCADVQADVPTVAAAVDGSE
jgi:hypothetical protein